MIAGGKIVGIGEIFILKIEEYSYFEDRRGTVVVETAERQLNFGNQGERESSFEPRK